MAALAALTVATPVASAWEAGQTDSPPAAARSGRRPLAVTTGDAGVATERLPGAAARTRSADDVMPRLPPASFISALIESTSVDNVSATIERLEAYGTRYVSTDSCLAAGRWIRERFLEYGYSDVRMDTFRTWTWQDSVLAVNVLAYKPGTTKPTEHVVLGGHYDSVTTQNFADPNAPAPGAEDNATGVACVLEAARLLSDMETERGVIFACWSAEEEGLWGSRAFVADAVDDAVDVVVYLNVDCIGYLSPPAPDGIIYADSSALSVAAWMCDVAAEFTGYQFEPEVQPLGASDQNSFWEAGYNVIDTAVEPSSPYMHTTEDVTGNLNVEFATAITALNVVAVAAAAGAVGYDPNLPPETTLVANCAASHDVVGASPTFEWDSADLDGTVSGFEYALTPYGETEEWRWLPGAARSISFSRLLPGDYSFSVRAVDEAGLRDPSPASHEFSVSDAFTPRLDVGTNFLAAPLAFGRSVDDGEIVSRDPQRVYENERLVFRLSADASDYCAGPESVAFATGDAGWISWSPSPCEFTFRPACGDTIVRFAALDSDGVVTTGTLRLAPVVAPMDLPLLQIDDWMGGDVPELEHDAFYDELMSGYEREVWDPLEHTDGGLPVLPSMEELGRYGMVVCSVGPGWSFLRASQAESSYHYFEGYVRAGGNFVLEGVAPMTALLGRDAATYDPSTPLPGFVAEHVGIDSMRNAGALTNPSYPDVYGWAFLGGTAIPGSGFDDVPVDTLGKWSDNYAVLGGIPWCETARPMDGTRRIYLFDSFTNPTLRDHPCATLRYPDDGTGMFAYFGFPFYYIQNEPARDMMDALLGEIADWRAPADLLFFDRAATPRSVTLTWYLDPPDGPAGCHIERRCAQAPQGDYARLNDETILPGAGGRFSFRDETVEPAGSYSYRLRVIERSGDETVHGPWTVQVPDVAPRDALEPPVPNPAPRYVGIHYSVGEDHRWVDVGVYDCSGRLVRVLERGAADRGEYDVVWDGTDESGRRVASGVYFVRAELGGSAFHRKVVIIR